MIDDVLYNEDVAQALRVRLQGNVDAMPTDAYRGDFALTPGLMPLFSQASLKESAVLIPLLMSEEKGLSVLLTKRAETLRTFPGDWVFPGGSVDADDADTVAAALRETSEEIGMDAQHIDILGRLPDYHVRSGFNMGIVVGLVRELTDLTLDPNEVADTMIVPLQDLFDGNGPRPYERDFEGHTITLYEFSYDGERIAGATAGVMMMLGEALSGEHDHTLDFSPVIEGLRV